MKKIFVYSFFALLLFSPFQIQAQSKTVSLVIKDEGHSFFNFLDSLGLKYNDGICSSFILNDRNNAFWEISGLCEVCSNPFGSQNSEMKIWKNGTQVAIDAQKEIETLILKNRKKLKARTEKLSGKTYYTL